MLNLQVFHWNLPGYDREFGGKAHVHNPVHPNLRYELEFLWARCLWLRVNGRPRQRNSERATM